MPEDAYFVMIFLRRGELGLQEENQVPAWQVRSLTDILGRIVSVPLLIRLEIVQKYIRLNKTEGGVSPVPDTGGGMRV